MQDQPKYHRYFGIPFLRTMSTTLLISIAGWAMATEGGVGRPITGMQILPLNGILPVEEGSVFNITSIYYEGTLNRSKNTALGGRIVGGVNYKVSYNLFNMVYVWRANERWSLGSSIGIPYQYSDIGVSIDANRRSVNLKDTSGNLSDLVFSPLMIDYHLNPISHLLFNLTVFAPTGDYNSKNLANTGQNTWTFIPTFAYTIILPNQNIELTGVAAVEFYTRNKDTDYKSGTIARLDGIVLKRFGQSGWGAGLDFGWIQQIEDDKGGLARQLSGNRGRALGIGPIISYEKKIGKTQLSTSFRWVREFNVKNRPKGNAFQLSFTAQF